MMGIDAVIHVDGYQDSEDTHAACARANERLESMGIEPDKIFPGYNRFNVYTNNEGGTYASFDNLWRYWGPGYERGPLFDIMGVIATAFWAFPGRTVYYGGDCDERPAVMDGTRFAELWVHYASDAADDYRNAFKDLRNWFQTGTDVVVRTPGGCQICDELFCDEHATGV
jgi:roadblock/LC7 domain-containing protein